MGTLAKIEHPYLPPYLGDRATAQEADRHLVNDLEALMPGQAQETAQAIALHREHEARAQAHVRKKDRARRR